MHVKKCPEAFQSAEVDGELVMIHGETGKFFALKDVGLDVWRKLDEEPELDAICTALAEEYDADEATIRDDVYAFARRIIGFGFAHAL